MCEKILNKDNLLEYSNPHNDIDKGHFAFVSSYLIDLVNDIHATYYLSKWGVVSIQMVGAWLLLHDKKLIRGG